MCIPQKYQWGILEYRLDNSKVQLNKQNSLDGSEKKE